MKRHFLPALAILAGFVAGYLIVPADREAKPQARATPLPQRTVSQDTLTFHQLAEKVAAAEQENPQSLIELFTEIAAERPGDIPRLLDEFKRGYMLPVVTDTIFRQLAKNDPAKAVALATSGRDTWKVRAIEATFDEWGSADPEMALEAATAIEDKTERGIAQNAVAKSICEQKPELAITMLDELETIGGSYSRTYRALAKKDPAAAVAALGKLDTPDHQRYVTHEVFDQLLPEYDFSGGIPPELDRILETVPPAVRRHAEPNIATATSAYDPGRAFERVRNLDEGRQP